MRLVKQKGWSEDENKEWDQGEGLWCFFSRVTRPTGVWGGSRTRENSRLEEKKVKTDYFAVYNLS